MQAVRLCAVAVTAVDGVILIDSRGKVLMLSYAAGGDREECQGAHA